MPQMTEKFVYGASQVAVPLSYSSLATDYEFHNVLREARRRLAYQVDLSAEARRLATALLDDIIMALSSR